MENITPDVQSTEAMLSETEAGLEEEDKNGGYAGNELNGYVNESDDKKEWSLCGKVVPKNQVVFFAQIMVLYLVIITCIANLSLHDRDSNLWTALLSSSLGLMLPGPGFKIKK